MSDFFERLQPQLSSSTPAGTANGVLNTDEKVGGGSGGQPIGEGLAVWPHFPTNNKERIEVQRLRKHDSFLGNKVDTYWYQFNSYPKPLDETKLPAIKQAIEQVLNDDGKVGIYERDGITFKAKHQYEEDLRKAFNASREKNITGDEYDERGVPRLKYKNFEEYKNSYEVWLKNK